MVKVSFTYEIPSTGIPFMHSVHCTLGTGLGQVLDKRFLVLAVFCKNFDGDDGNNKDDDDDDWND